MRDRRTNIKVRVISFLMALFITLSLIAPISDVSYTEVDAGTVWGSMTPKAQKTANFCYSYLTSKHKLRSETALALLANMDRETDFDYTKSDRATCYGIFSSTGNRADKMADAQKGKKGDEMIKAQIDVAIQEAKDLSWKTYCEDKYCGNLNTKARKNKVHFKETKSWRAFKKLSGHQASTMWMNCWERPDPGRRFEFAKENLKYYDSMVGKVKGSTSADAGSSSGLSQITMSDFTFIGDSRTVGMFRSVKDAKDSQCKRISHIGVGSSFLNKIIENKLKTCDDCGGNSGTSNHEGDYKLSTDCVVIWLGVNDLVNKHKAGSSEAVTKSIQAVAKKYQKSIAKLQESGKTVVWVACGNVWEGGSGAKSIRNSSIKTFNNAMKKYCDDNGVTYVKVNNITALKDKKSDLSGGKNSDGVHYTAKVYEEVWKRVQEAQQQIIEENASQGNDGEVDGSNQSGTVKVTGALDEEYFGVYGTHLKENSIALPNADMLTVNEQKQIATWGNNIGTLDESYIGFMRRVISFLGIMFTIYCLFIYLAYWLDRVNTFFDISFLSMLTLGNLELSPDEKQSTFNPANEGKKIVNHKDVIKIVVIGCIVGVLLISGWVYKGVALVLDLIEKILSYF